ncbi:TPA: hypothetical protein MH733_18890 [Klebsiella pneumoniae]|nr:hypothetical protein DMT32_26980 [Klebsiella variicola]HBX6637071.1 hypothetical protein [Klebsiella pneumoniae]HBX6642537.1 hypothetical protein [Klebsiella pneumoniae]HBX6648152.1 hypothetical protein [Klebsiella pneumoniae]HBX6681215.1 hypothetical protein [Klebsiella pneumoniae]
MIFNKFHSYTPDFVRLYGFRTTMSQLSANSRFIHKINTVYFFININSNFLQLAYSRDVYGTK